MIQIPKTTFKLLHQNASPNQNPGTKISFQYGTAGFRYKHTLLPHVFVKMGILAALRSYSQQGQTVGLMCTASHNLEDDNGIKMADPDGGMLNSDIWEQYAVSLANAISVEDVHLVLQEIISKEFASIPNTNQRFQMKVHFGRDTRSHSAHLISLAIAAADSLNDVTHPTFRQSVQIIDHGIVTTPQLHYFVMHANSHLLPNAIPFHYHIHGYFDAICHSYLSLLNTKTTQGDQSSLQRPKQRIWIVDCACGVGSYQIQTLEKKLNQLTHSLAAQFKVVNAVNDGPLNDKCGAEYVQKQQKPPILYSEGLHQKRIITSNSRLQSELDRFEKISFLKCSLDGDADRIVFHYQTNDSQSSFHLLDGDKIAVLVANFVQKELTHLMKVLDKDEESDLRCGVVQTAYANGASTDYLKVCFISLISISHVMLRISIFVFCEY